jgi:hypothetical protein
MMTFKRFQLSIKRFQLSFVLLALVLVMSLVTPLAMVNEGRTLTINTHALYNFPQVSARAVPVPVSLGAFVYGIPRPDFYYAVAERRDAIIRASWVSPREGRKVRLVQQVYHRQIVRVLF